MCSSFSVSMCFSRGKTLREKNAQCFCMFLFFFSQLEGRRLCRQDTTALAFGRRPNFENHLPWRSRFAWWSAPAKMPLGSMTLNHAAMPLEPTWDVRSSRNRTPTPVIAAPPWDPWGQTVGWHQDWRQGHSGLGMPLCCLQDPLEDLGNIAIH